MSEVYSVAGDVDLVVLVRVPRHDDLADVITGRLAKTPGVVDTVTHVGFRTYSRHDLEAAFAIGFDEGRASPTDGPGARRRSTPPLARRPASRPLSAQ